MTLRLGVDRESSASSWGSGNLEVPLAQEQHHLARGSSDDLGVVALQLSSAVQATLPDQPGVNAVFDVANPFHSFFLFPLSRLSFPHLLVLLALMDIVIIPQRRCGTLAFRNN